MMEGNYHAKHNTPFDYNVREFNEETGEWEYYVTIHKYGKDEDGFFEIVQDGPAQGERAYFG